MTNWEGERDYDDLFPVTQCSGKSENILKLTVALQLLPGLILHPHFMEDFWGLKFLNYIHTNGVFA